MSKVGGQYVTDDGQVRSVLVDEDVLALMFLIPEPLEPFLPKHTDPRRIEFTRLFDGQTRRYPSSLPWTYALGSLVFIGTDFYVVTRLLDERGKMEY